MNATATAGTTTWIYTGHACRILETYSERLRGMADRGLIRTRQVPGSRKQYCLEDVRQVAESIVSGGKESAA